MLHHVIRVENEATFDEANLFTEIVNVDVGISNAKELTARDECS